MKKKSHAKQAAKVHVSHEQATPLNLAHSSKHDKSYSLAIIAIIAILIIVFMVTSYLQYSRVSYIDSTGQAYVGQNPGNAQQPQLGKKIITSEDISDQYAYLRDPDNK
jgi:hypothetical protein